MHAGFRSDHRHCSGSGCASRSSAHESNELDVCLHRRLRNVGVRMSTIRGISLEIVSGDFSCRLMDRIVGILDKVDTVDVGDPGKESNASWIIARGAHKKPTYAQMVKASNRVVSEVRKRTSNRVLSEVSILSSTGNRSHTRKIRT